MIINKDTIDRFVKETGLNVMIGYFDGWNDFYNKIDFSNIKEYNCITICGFTHDGINVAKWFKTPKAKEVTLDYIMNKVNEESIYRNLSNLFSKLCKNIPVYPTTYGIGIDAFYNREMRKEIKMVEDKLNELGIEYRNEFSEAGYVYRFVISKKSVNLKKIK